MSDKDVFNAGHSLVQRFKEFVSGVYAQVFAVIPYASDGSEIFTTSSPARVAGQNDLVELTLTLNTDGAYADGDVLADTQPLANACLDGETVTIWNMTILDKDDQGQPFDIYILRSDQSIGTENSAFEPSDAVAEEILCRIPVASDDYVDLTNSQIAFLEPRDAGVGLVTKPTSGTALYVAAVSRGTGSYTAAGIVIKFGLLK